MIRYPTIEQIRELHRNLIERSGGSHGVRDEGALSSSLTQPLMTFGGQELYLTLIEKAAMLGFFLIKNHPFIDGNKRIGHAAMELLLRFNGCRIVGEVGEQEKTILALAAGEMDKDAFFDWVQAHCEPLA